MHKHHIMPRHLGGTNDPENIVKVSVAEHAEIHRCLWIYGGRWQDEVAWKALSRLISGEEAHRLASKHANTKPKSEQTRKNMKGRCGAFPKPWNIGENNPSCRPEIRALLSEQKKGDKNPSKRPEVRAKKSKALSGVPWSAKRRKAQEQRCGPTS